MAVANKIFAAQFALHKGKSGAAQFSPIAPTWDEKPGKDGTVLHKCVREGAIFLEVAKLLGKDPNGNDTFDWKNKISFAIGVPDVCKILDGFLTTTKFELYHETGEGTSKKLIFTPGEGNYEGTWRMMLSTHSKSDPSSNQAITVPMSPGEAAFFIELVRASPRKLLGWDYGN